MQLDNFQKALEKTFLLVLLTILLISCRDLTQGPIKIQPLPAGEAYVSHAYNSKYGTVVGSRNIYFTFGKTSLGERAGTGLAPDHKFYYRIKDLVERWRQIDDPRVQKAIKQQEELLKKVPLQ